MGNLPNQKERGDDHGFICHFRECGLVLPDKQSLSAHLLSLHTCSACHRQYPQFESLQLHCNFECEAYQRDQNQERGARQSISASRPPRMSVSSSNLFDFVMDSEKEFHPPTTIDEVFIEDEAEEINNIASDRLVEDMISSNYSVVGDGHILYSPSICAEAACYFVTDSAYALTPQLIDRFVKVGTSLDDNQHHDSFDAAFIATERFKQRLAPVSSLEWNTKEFHKIKDDFRRLNEYSRKDALCGLLTKSAETICICLTPTHCFLFDPCARDEQNRPIGARLYRFRDYVSLHTYLSLLFPYVDFDDENLNRAYNTVRMIIVKRTTSHHRYEISSDARLPSLGSVIARGAPIDFEEKEDLGPATYVQQEQVVAAEMSSLLVTSSETAASAKSESSPQPSLPPPPPPPPECESPPLLPPVLPSSRMPHHTHTQTSKAIIDVTTYPTSTSKHQASTSLSSLPSDSSSSYEAGTLEVKHLRQRLAEAEIEKLELKQQLANLESENSVIQEQLDLERAASHAMLRDIQMMKAKQQRYNLQGIASKPPLPPKIGGFLEDEKQPPPVLKAPSVAPSQDHEEQEQRPRRKKVEHTSSQVFHFSPT